MTDTTQYPSIEHILDYADMGTEMYKWSKESVAALAAEIRALLTSNEVNAKLAVEWEVKHHALRTQIAEMGREMASVVAERDALKAQQPKKPERKLREVRVRGGGFTHAVTFDGKEFVFNNANGSKRKYMTLSEMVKYHNAVSWTDDVIAQCIALKDDPYEPVETVETVLDEYKRAVVKEHKYGFSGVLVTATDEASYLNRLRAAVAAEQGGAE